MKLNELGFDFSNASNFLIRKKNKIMELVAFILFAVFFFISAVFVILYLLKVNIESNGLTYSYGQPEYNRIFMTMFIVFGSLLAMSVIILLISLFVKPRVYIIKGQDQNLYPFYYIYAFGKEIYVGNDRLLYYYKRYQKVYDESKDKSSWEKVYRNHLFWKNFENIQSYKIKSTNKFTILKFKERIGRLTYRKTYKFDNVVQILPNKVIEYVNVYSGGNNRGGKYNVYHIEDINRRHELILPPELKRVLNETS